MRRLVDSDAFCKLAASGLLSDAAVLFHAELGDCGRLPALPHMLRRGRLRRMYGTRVCERLIPLAERMPPVVGSPTSWLEELAHIPDIDPGEAILFATAADRRIPVVTGDIRSLRALKNLDRFLELATAQRPSHRKCLPRAISASKRVHDLPTSDASSARTGPLTTTRSRAASSYVRLSCAGSDLRNPSRSNTDCSIR